ncbi:MAG: hypothetical protein IJ572_00990 [Bacilli bacterium]|nr:hypothetical protein [Bacilli bacterium]
MSDLELYEVVGGGFSFSAAFLNAMSRTINTIMDFGRTIGTSIRMLVSGKRC